MARAFLISSLFVAGTTPPARASDWTLAAQAVATGGYDDNIRLSSVNATEAWTAIGDAGVQLQFREEIFLWQFNPRLRIVRYSEDPAMNRTEQYVTMLAQLAGERSSSSFTFSGVQDTTLTSELGLTGLAAVNKKHHAGSVTLSNQYSVSERLQTSAQIYSSVNRYVDAERTGLVDYYYSSASLRASYSVSEVASISLQGAAGLMRLPDLSQLDKDNYSITLGYAWQFAQRWRIDMSAGPSRIATALYTDTGEVYDATLTHKSDLLTLTLAAVHDVTPTGQGLLTRREQVRFGLDKSFTPRWSGNLSVAGIRSRVRNLLPTGQLELGTVTYGAAAGALTWMAAPDWSISLSAGYTLQRTGNDQRQAERRHAGLSVSWSGLARRLN